MIDETAGNTNPVDASQANATQTPGANADTAAGWNQNTTYTGSTASATSGLPPRPLNPPNPTLAGFLGAIPGAGAMYNGQYAKALAHLVIFLFVSELQKGADFLGLVVAVWWIYMIIDAYTTARAIRDGQPLPNPFNLNDIGTTLGFGRNWPGSSGRPVQYATAAPWGPGPATAAGAAYQPTPQPNWVGYAPPEAYPNVPPPTPVPQQAQTGAGWGHVPYSETYTGGVPPVAAGFSPVPPVSPTKGFPVAALVLIVLGALFLLHNWIPEFHVGPSWIAAIALGGASVWTFLRRFSYLGGADHAFEEENRQRLICSLRGPVMMMVLAIMFLLQACYVATIGQTWPLILVSIGLLLLLERTVGSAPANLPVAGGTGYAAPGTSNDDSLKGGR